MRTLSTLRVLVNVCSKSPALHGLKPSYLPHSTTLLTSSSFNPPVRFLRYVIYVKQIYPKNQILKMDFMLNQLFKHSKGLARGPKGPLIIWNSGASPFEVWKSRLLALNIGNYLI